MSGAWANFGFMNIFLTSSYDRIRFMSFFVKLWRVFIIGLSFGSHVVKTQWVGELRFMKFGGGMSCYDCSFLGEFLCFPEVNRDCYKIYLLWKPGYLRKQVIAKAGWLPRYYYYYISFQFIKLVLILKKHTFVYIFALTFAKSRVCRVNRSKNVHGVITPPNLFPLLVKLEKMNLQMEYISDKYNILGVGYTGVKNHFFVILFLQQFFCIPYTLFQHEMTKFLAWGLRKKCAGPKSKMVAVFPQKSHFQP